jgi:hypothetical protein
MKLRALALGTAVLAAIVPTTDGHAQEINFSKIDKFESLSSGTLRVGAPAKTIVDDGERHAVVLTIWDADAETKVYWRSPDGNALRTTVIPGRRMASSSSKPLVRPITRSNSGTCCLAWRNKSDIGPTIGEPPELPRLGRFRSKAEVARTLVGLSLS